MDMTTQSTTLRPLQVEALSVRAQLIKRASTRIPVTGEDLPVGFYRADLLPLEPYQARVDDTDSTDSLAQAQLEEVQALQAAYIELSYDHGYPTLPSGEPFWHKLDYEPALAYGAFQIYLDTGNTGGAREISELARNEEFLGILGSTLGSQATHQQALEVLNEYYVLYYWRPRAKAHDLFKEAAYRHVRVKRAMNAEDYHYRLAETLLKRVETYLSTDGFIDGLTPKVALDALKALVAIQRVSAGLPSAGPLPAKDSPESTQFEYILRQLSQKQPQSNGLLAPQQSDTLGDILKDPVDVRTMQELIIRVTQRAVQPATHESSRRTFDASGEDITDAEDAEFHGNI